MRASDVQRRSRRVTLLCCLTFSSLLLFVSLLISTNVLPPYSIDETSNGSVSLNLVEFRSSLVRCGRSVVKKDHWFPTIEQLTKLLKSVNRSEEFFVHGLAHNEALRRDTLLWLDDLLVDCSQARRASIVEQERPTMIRRLVSWLRKEFFYLATFVVKGN